MVCLLPTGSHSETVGKNSSDILVNISYKLYFILMQEEDMNYIQFPAQIPATLGKSSQVGGWGKTFT